MYKYKECKQCQTLSCSRKLAQVETERSKDGEDGMLMVSDDRSLTRKQSGIHYSSLPPSLSVQWQESCDQRSCHEATRKFLWLAAMRLALAPTDFMFR